MLWLKKLWFHFTAYVPRKTPRTGPQFQTMLNNLFIFYGLPATPQTKVMISGILTSWAPHKRRISYGRIANTVHRLATNELAHQYKMAAQKELEAQLAEIAEKIAKGGDTNGDQSKEGEPSDDGQPLQAQGEVDKTEAQGQSIPLEA